MQGAFEAAACGGGRVRQVPAPDVAAGRRSPGRRSADPYTLLGDLSWSNYTVSADVMLEQAGYVELHRAGSAPRTCDPAEPQNAYYLRVTDTGAWSILRNNTSSAADDPAQRHRGRAGHQHAGTPWRSASPAAPITATDRRRDRRHASPTPPSAPARSASAPARARPPSSTTSAITAGTAGSRRLSGRCAASGVRPLPGRPGASRRPTAPRWRCGTATAAPTSSGR